MGAPVKKRPGYRARSTYFSIDLIKWGLHFSRMDSMTALADPTRRRIVETLARGALSSGDIARRFDISASAISQHLKTLRAAGLVRARPAAQRRIYELDPRG